VQSGLGFIQCLQQAVGFLSLPSAVFGRERRCLFLFFLREPPPLGSSPADPVLGFYRPVKRSFFSYRFPLHFRLCAVPSFMAALFSSRYCCVFCFPTPTSGRCEFVAIAVQIIATLVSPSILRSFAGPAAEPPRRPWRVLTLSFTMRSSNPSVLSPLPLSIG